LKKVKFFGLKKIKDGKQPLNFYKLTDIDKNFFFDEITTSSYDNYGQMKHFHLASGKCQLLAAARSISKNNV
jgi:hypothetical protein